MTDGHQFDDVRKTSPQILCQSRKRESASVNFVLGHSPDVDGVSTRYLLKTFPKTFVTLRKVWSVTRIFKNVMFYANHDQQTARKTDLFFTVLMTSFVLPVCECNDASGVFCAETTGSKT